MKTKRYKWHFDPKKGRYFKDEIKSKYIEPNNYYKGKRKMQIAKQFIKSLEK